MADSRTRIICKPMKAKVIIPSDKQSPNDNSNEQINDQNEDNKGKLQ